MSRYLFSPIPTPGCSWCSGEGELVGFERAVTGDSRAGCSACPYQAGVSDSPRIGVPEQAGPLSAGGDDERAIHGTGELLCLRRAAEAGRIEHAAVRVSDHCTRELDEGVVGLPSACVNDGVDENVSLSQR